MNQSFATFEHIVRKRRTTKPPMMNGQKIPDEQVKDLLKLANWAPTHGRTEPWRFYVYTGESMAKFCQEHADMYKSNTPEDKFVAATYENLRNMGNKASHLIIAIMKRGNLPKIPAWEEMAATSAAVEHILLGATALGMASYWGSGGMITHQAMKDHYQLGEEDMVLGAVYLGYADVEMPAVRNTWIEEKAVWL